MDQNKEGDDPSQRVWSPESEMSWKKSRSMLPKIPHIVATHLIYSFFCQGDYHNRKKKGAEFMIHLNVLDAWSNWNNSKIHKLMSEHLLSLYWIENMLKKHLGNLYLGVQRMLSMSIYIYPLQ